MRKPLLALSILALLGVPAACNDSTAKTSEDAAPIGSWSTLSSDFNGFVNKVNQSRTAATSKAMAGNDPAKVAKAVGYDFSKGVTLKEWKDTATSISFCLTGPDGTYITTTLQSSGLTRTLGTGKCDYTKGDIISKIDDSATNASAAKTVEKITKGKTHAAKIPSFKKNPFAIQVQQSQTTN